MVKRPCPYSSSILNPLYITPRTALNMSTPTINGIIPSHLLSSFIKAQVTQSQNREQAGLAENRDADPKWA
jgi:hypothetical protein